MGDGKNSRGSLMLDEKDLDLITEVLNIYFTSLFSTLQNTEAAMLIPTILINKQWEGDDLREASRILFNAQKDKLNHVDELKVKIRQLKSKLMDTKGKLTLDDIVN